MRQLIYALRFTGQANPTGPDGKASRNMTAAPSSVLRSSIGPDGLESVLEAVDGGQAVYEAEATVTGDNTFVEAGTIRFGPGHSLRFTTVGSGTFGPSPDPALIQGSATFRVEGGEGQFAGAAGLITCNFVETRQRELTDYHLGVLFLP